MDKKLLDALNNLSFALEELVTSMNDAKKDKNKSATSSALTSGKIDKKLELINKGIKDLQSDNKKILKNQEELLKIAKSQKNDSPVGEAAEPKKKSRIVDGLATIMLIAVGVLAIGMAFKIIGKVNFLSVIALSIAIVVIAIAFEKVVKLGITPAQAALTSLTMVIMSTAVMLSSWILSNVSTITLAQFVTAAGIAALFYFVGPAIGSMISALDSEIAVEFEGNKIQTKKLDWGKLLAAVVVLPLVMITMSIGIMVSSKILSMVTPLSPLQMITSVLIAAMFALVANGMKGLILALTDETEAKFKGFGGKMKGLSIQKLVAVAIILPLMMMAISAGITLSSWVLQGIKPVGFFKLVTAILIGAAFAALGYGVGQIIKALKDVDEKKALVASLIIPIVFVALALAIAASSHIFQLIKPVGFFKLLTALLIGIVFIPLAFALQYIAIAISKIDIKKAWMIPVALILLATAIMASSYLFDLTTPIPFMKLLNILFQSIVLAAIGFVFSFVIAMIAKISVKDIIKGGIVLIGLATVVMISSLIFNMGTYDNYPGIFWVLGVAASLAAFAFGALTIGGMVFGPQALVVAAGLAAILVISAAIVAVSYILNEGSYDKYPSLFWAGGVAASLGAFAAIGISLGLTGILAMIGIPFMIGIANTIVEISNILAGGNYDLPGFASWALTVALLYGTFTPILLILAPIALASAVLGAFGANPWQMAGEMMKGIAQTMVDISNVLAKGNYKDGPTLEWAGGVAIALGAFAPIYGMLVRNKIMEFLGGGGIGPDDFNQAIRTVVGGIQFAADAFAGFAEKAYPKKEWAEGVGLAISSFAPVYDILAKSKDGWLSKGGPTPEEFTRAIMVVCQGILDAAEFFGENIAAFDLEKVPKKEWGERVGGAISAFSPALEFITKNGKWWKKADPEIIGKAIRATAYGIKDSSLILIDGDYSASITKTWVDNTRGAISAYVDLAMWLYKQNGMTSAMDFLHDVSTNIRNVSNKLADGTYTDSFTAKWVEMLDDGVKAYVNLAMWVYAQDGLSNSMSYFYNQVSWYIQKTSERFSDISDNMRTVDKNWMKSVTDNVKEYVYLAMWLAGNDVDVSIVNNSVTGMYKMAYGYSTLASSIKKLNTSLEELDVEKLNALRNLNSSVVLMSLMDPEQFKSMMDELEEKGGVLIDALQDLESTEASTEKGQKKGAPAPQVKKGGGGGGESQKSISDLYTVMQSVETRLGEIAKHSDKLSKYVDEIRGDDNWMRKR
jgi:hypothetical protein